MSRLPPYGRQYCEKPPAAGLRIAFGKHAWKYAKLAGYPVMVLPENGNPNEFIWPDVKRGAVLHEIGEPDDTTLNELARAVLGAGAPFVIALRHSLVSVKGADPRVYFYPEAQGVAA